MLHNILNVLLIWTIVSIPVCLFLGKFINHGMNTPAPTPADRSVV